jgi:cytochrome-b5 reductase
MAIFARLTHPSWLISFLITVMLATKRLLRPTSYLFLTMTASSPFSSSSTSVSASSPGGNYKLPSTMQGNPVSALVPPGNCQFGPDKVSVPLLDRTPVSKTSFVLRFGLPDPNQPLKLSTCACILANALIDGETVTRPYTPISTNAQKGSFDLLIKHYPDGKMSSHMCETIQVGETVAFSHIDKNVKIQAPFPFKHIGMLVGGTGITPMIQALHAILGGEPDCKVTMLYGSKTSDDILGKELLDQWVNKYPNLNVIYVLSEEPKDSDWSGERGFVSKELIQKHFPAASEDDIHVFICGPPPMYSALSGPRDESQVGGVLGELGYKQDQVFKF